MSTVMRESVCEKRTISLIYLTQSGERVAHCGRQNNSECNLAHNEKAIKSNVINNITKLLTPPPFHAYSTMQRQ